MKNSVSNAPDEPSPTKPAGGVASCPAGPACPARREFLTRAAAVVCGGAATLVPIGAGLITVLDPLRRGGAAGEAPFLLVTSLSSLPEDGTPRRFEVVADHVDAWNKFPNVAIGAVYLRRADAKRVEALHVTCPHAGCPVEFKAATRDFLCPCHDSRFNLDGSLTPGARSPSPRGLDALDVEVRDSGEVWVRFQNFEAGKAEKVPLV